MSGTEDRDGAHHAGLGRSIAISTLGYALPLLASLGVAPILAHTLGVQGRGELANATAPFTLLITAATLGVPESLTYHIASGRTARRRLTRHGLALQAAVGVVAAGLLVLLSDWLAAGSSHVARLIAWSALAIVPALVVGGLRGAAAGLHRWTEITVERGITAAVRIVGIAALAIAGTMSVTAAAVVTVVAPVVGALAYVRLPRALAAGGLPDDEPTIRPIVAYGSRVWIGSLTGVLLMRLDQAVFAPLSGAYELGLYAAAAAISEIPLVINSGVRNVVFAADSSRPDNARLGAAARISALACTVVGVLIALVLRPGIPLAFGADFLPAIPATLVLLLAVVLGVPGSVAGSGLSSRGHPGLRSTALTIACVVNAVLLVALVPPLGAFGAALATLAGNLVSANLNIVWFRRLTGVSPWAFYGLRRSDVAEVAAVARRVASRRRGR